MSPLDTKEQAILELVKKAKDGCTESYSKIYDHYFNQIYRYAALRVPSEVAEDLVAEIFVKAWEKLHMFKEQKGVPFGAWLFRIARNEIIDTYRTSKTWEEIDDALVDTDKENRADTEANRMFLLKIVREAMDKLPRRYYDILSLCFIADLSHEEAAKVLRCSEGSVRVLKFRALKKLKEELPPGMEENL
ncbi:MAG: RNA polymerase sigma factor [Candidatus Peribacteraceae bacterium]|jgi:RNA polymerase sigma-70 factor (ECF subfamily)|nr:RNA polymerase sigma factor [Candidatus Peribacteraceae bacterium]|tara:strand:+ start:5886 stop:6455 length:570 start_codon:yes stop_codon:yes gene_type:complete